jgi:asparagine synthase (glutamine-hydrolysing)
VQFIYSLRETKNKRWVYKMDIRKSMEYNIPKEIIWRKGKVGFEPPQKEWMHDKRVHEMIMEGRKNW